MYSNDQELYWSNVTLMTYKDKSFGTDGFLRLSLSSSTSNFKDFNQPKLNMMISNNNSKTCQLDIINSEDLFEAAERALTALKLKNNNLDFQSTQIKRIIRRNIQLIFTIFMDENRKIPLVRVDILSNESDFVSTIMPLQYEFMTLIRIIKRFKDDYFTVVSNLMSQAAMSQILNLPELIKGLPSGIVSKIPAQDFEAPVSEEVKQGAAEMEQTIDNLDSFMDLNLETAKVPELEKATEEHVTVFESKFVSDILKNDLLSLEKILLNETLSTNPIHAFSLKFSELYGMEYKALPGIMPR